MSIPIDSIVDVNVSVSAGTSRTREFSTLLITNDGEVLDASGSNKVRSYDAASDLEDDYAQSVKNAAAAYFAQDNYPNSLLIGRWLNVNANHVLTGGAPDTAANLDDISDGQFNFLGEDFTAIDLSSSATYTAQATAIQTKIRASSSTGFDGISVSYDAALGVFVVDIPPAITPTYFGNDTDGTGTDLETLLGLTEAAGASLRRGGEAESITSALNAIQTANPNFYCVVTDIAWANDVDTQSEVITWAAANQGFALCDVSGDEVLVANETSSPAAQIANLRSNYSAITWSNQLDHKSMSVAGQICSRNLDAPGSAYTLKFKTLQGRAADNINSAQKNELDRKNINVFGNYQGNRAFYGEGRVTGAYGWIDIPVYATWFAERMQNDILVYLTSPATKIPQTDGGINGLLAEMDAVCEAAVDNGGVGSGHLSARQRAEVIATTGDDDFDGELTAGYLNYIQPLSEQSQAQRESRDAPPAYSWIKLTGAMHSAVIGVRVEQ